MLNYSGQERRCPLLTGGRIIDCEQILIIVGLMNPLTYLGTQQVPKVNLVA